MGKRKKFKCIYGLFAPDNSVYIGQTTDPVNRKSRYKTMTCKNQRKVFQSLLNHGYDKHEFRVLHLLEDSATREHLDYHESFFFAVYQQNGYNLLNLKSAGWNGKHSQESRQIASESHKGQKVWNKGLKGAQVAWNKGLKKQDYATR